MLFRPCTIFASTSLQIARATASSIEVTGHWPHELLSTQLQHHIHPDDIAAVEGDVRFLVRNTRLPGELYSHYTIMETLSSSALQDSDHDARLREPAQGMYEPYPNRYIRIRCNDGVYREYHMCLCIGGAFGTSMWRPESYSNSYIVINIRAVVQRLQAQPAFVAGLASPPYSPALLPPAQLRHRVGAANTPSSIRQPETPIALPSISSILKSFPSRASSVCREEMGSSWRRSEAELGVQRIASEKSRLYDKM